jgi:hypothetical protein
MGFKRQWHFVLIIESFASEVMHYLGAFSSNKLNLDKLIKETSLLESILHTISILI